jgi:hypothetical protein
MVRCHLYPLERRLGGPRAIVDALEKLNLHLPGIKLQFAHVQPVA